MRLRSLITFNSSIGPRVLGPDRLQRRSSWPIISARRHLSVQSRRAWACPRAPRCLFLFFSGSFLLNDCSTESPVREERTGAERVSAGPSLPWKRGRCGPPSPRCDTHFGRRVGFHRFRAGLTGDRGPDGSPVPEQQRPPARVQLRQQTMGVAAPLLLQLQLLTPGRQLRGAAEAAGGGGGGQRGRIPADLRQQQQRIQHVGMRQRLHADVPRVGI